MGKNVAKKWWGETPKTIANNFLWNSNPGIKGVRGRQCRRPEMGKTLTSVLPSLPFNGCPYHSTYPYLTNPGKPSSCLSTFQRPWSYYLHWDSFESQSLLIDYSVYVVHFSPQMSYYMNSEFTKDISIVYTWHVVKIPTFDTFVSWSLKACMLVICTCPLSQKKNLQRFLQHWFENWRWT